MESQKAPTGAGTSNPCLSPPGNAYSIKNKILNLAAVGQAPACRGGSAGLLLGKRALLSIL